MTTIKTDTGQDVHLESVNRATVTVNGKTLPVGQIRIISGHKVWHQFTPTELQAHSVDAVTANSSLPTDKQAKAAARAASETPDGRVAAAAERSKATAKSSYATWTTTQLGGAPDPFGAAAQVDTGLPDAGAKEVITHRGSGNGPRPGGAEGHVTNQSVQSQTGDQLLQSIYGMKPDEVKQLQQKMVDAGSSSVNVTGIVDAATLNAWTTLVHSAQLYQTKDPANGYTPMELLDATAAAKSKASKTISEKSTSVDLTDPVKARQTLVDAMSAKLGRKPTDQEIAAFTSALNAHEQASPTTTDSTVTTNPDGTEKSRQSTTTGSSTDPGAFAQSYITDNHGPEAQALNHLSFYNIALQSLQGSGVNTGLST